MYLLLPPVPQPRRFCLPYAAGGNYAAKEDHNKQSVRTWLLYTYKHVEQVHRDAGNSNRAVNDETGFINDGIQRHRVTQGNNQCVSCMPAGRKGAPQHTDATTGQKAAETASSTRQHSTAPHERPQRG